MRTRMHFIFQLVLALALVVALVAGDHYMDEDDRTGTGYMDCQFAKRPEREMPFDEMILDYGGMEPAWNDSTNSFVVGSFFAAPKGTDLGTIKSRFKITKKSWFDSAMTAENRPNHIVKIYNDFSEVAGNLHKFTTMATFKSYLFDVLVDVDDDQPPDDFPYLQRFDDTVQDFYAAWIPVPMTEEERETVSRVRHEIMRELAGEWRVDACTKIILI